MAKPTTETQIANLALRHLQTAPILSIDPPDNNSKAAQCAYAWYDQARRDTLEAHPWKFACKLASLAADAADPDFGYDKRYQLPSDYIRLVQIGEDWRNPVTEYDIVANFIHCSESAPLDIIYVYDLEDASKFSPKFITALSYKLAELMAMDLTGNAQYASAMAEQFTRGISGAMAVAGQNRPTQRIQKSRLADERRSLGRYRDWQRWGDE